MTDFGEKTIYTKVHYKSHKVDSNLIVIRNVDEIFRVDDCDDRDDEGKRASHDSGKSSAECRLKQCVDAWHEQYCLNNSGFVCL